MRRMRKGFTLIEVIVAVGISLAILAYVLANFYRGGDNSLLNRESSLLMARIRLAQEETSSGKTFSYCYHFTGMTCTGNGNVLKVCDNDPTIRCTTSAQCGGGLCKDTECEGKTCCPDGVGVDTCPPGHSTPDGGFAISLSCEAHLPSDGLHEYPMFEKGKSIYGLYAERKACVYSDNCFPPKYVAFDDSLISTDGIVSTMHYVGGAFYRLKGDTVQEQYTVNSAVEIADIQITAEDDIVPTLGVPKKSFHCGDSSPWENIRVHTAGGSSSKVPVGYPIQVAIRFAPPDPLKPRTQQVNITDNVSTTPPPYSATPTNAWVKAEIMLKLKKRNNDCQVVTVTRAGVISNRTDVDCNITTTN